MQEEILLKNVPTVEVSFIVIRCKKCGKKWAKNFPAGCSYQNILHSHDLVCLSCQKENK